MAEDGGLLLQLLQVDAIVDAAEAEAVQEASGTGPAMWDWDADDEGVYAGGSRGW